VRWMVLYHPPDCIGFFQRMLVIRWRHFSSDFTSSDGEAAQHLLMTHFPGCQPIEEHHSSERFLQEPAQEDWNLASEVVSEDKVRWAIDGFGTFKVAGEDGLQQHGFEIIIGHILPHVWRMVTYHWHGRP
jgi:hypothetical protein